MLQKSSAFVRKRIPYEATSFFFKGCRFAVQREPTPVKTKGTPMFVTMPGSNGMLLVKTRLAASIQYDEFRRQIEVAVGSNHHHAVGTICLVIFPRGLE